MISAWSSAACACITSACAAASSAARWSTVGLRDVLVADQLLAALQLQRGVDLRRLGLGEIGALLLDRRLVGGLLDAEQEVAGLDLLPFGERALLDEARNARDDVDLVDRRHAADEIPVSVTWRLTTGVTETDGGGAALGDSRPCKNAQGHHAGGSSPSK